MKACAANRNGQMPGNSIRFQDRLTLVECFAAGRSAPRRFPPALAAQVFARCGPMPRTAPRSRRAACCHASTAHIEIADRGRGVRLQLRCRLRSGCCLCSCPPGRRPESPHRNSCAGSAPPTASPGCLRHELSRQFVGAFAETPDGQPAILSISVAERFRKIELAS